MTDKGYRVFFSRISLEDKLGQQYEPYIFAALNSAKVMLAFGTKYEYYHAVWVKNEWSRFLKLMAKDKSKALVPCYKDLDPYDMPDEFKVLQAQDMGKVGAVQDLMRGIDKLLARPEQTSVQKTGAVNNQTNATNAVTTDSLIRRAFMFLEDGEWDNANAYCEKVLDIDPENAQAYLIKLMVDLRLYNATGFELCNVNFENNKNYKKVMAFGGNEINEYLQENLIKIKNERSKDALEQKRIIEEQNKKEEQQRYVMQRLEYRQKGLCHYCGGEFNGFLFKVCSKCGKPKDY